MRTLINTLFGLKRVADKEVSLDEVIGIIEANSEFIDGKISMEVSRVWKYSPGLDGLSKEKREPVKKYVDDYNDVIKHLVERYKGKESMFEFRYITFKNTVKEKHYIEVKGKKTIVPVGEKTARYEPQDTTKIEYKTNKLKKK